VQQESRAVTLPHSVGQQYRKLTLNPRASE